MRQDSKEQMTQYSKCPGEELMEQNECRRVETGREKIDRLFKKGRQLSRNSLKIGKERKKEKEREKRKKKKEKNKYLR